MRGRGRRRERALAAWDRDAAVLLEEARLLHRAVHDVPVPAALSASALVRLAADPDGLARDLARPMPRPPAPAARRGTRFHGWVEGLFGAQPLLDRTDLEGAADDDLVDDADLASLQAAFLAGPYASTPPHRVEAPFQLVLGGRVVRGRIDAVYQRADGGFDVVDWKTGAQASDPLQLAVYRAAWAQIAGVPESEVGAAFYYVARGEVVRHDDLPGADGAGRRSSPAPADPAPILRDAPRHADTGRASLKIGAGEGDVDGQGAVVADVEGQCPGPPRTSSGSTPRASTWSSCTRGRYDGIRRHLGQRTPARDPPSGRPPAG